MEQQSWMKVFAWVLIVILLVNVLTGVTLIVQGAMLKVQALGVPEEVLIVYEEVEVPVFPDETGFGEDLSCSIVPDTVSILYLHDARWEGPYRVVDCLGAGFGRPEQIIREELVEVSGFLTPYVAIAQNGDPWLQVTVWPGVDKSFVINLDVEETQ